MESEESTPSGTKGTSNFDVANENLKVEGQTLVPQLADGGVTQAELQTAIKVLKAVAALGSTDKRKGKRKAIVVSDEANDGTSNSRRDNEDDEQYPYLQAYKHVNLRPLRKALAQCIAIHQRTMYEGKSREEYQSIKVKEKTLKRQKNAETIQQQKYLAGTALRRGRIERLKEKQSEAKDEEMAKLQQQMMIPDGHVETHLPSGHQLLPPPSENERNSVPQEDSQPIQLPKLRSCYVCKDRFRELHHFYDQLCPVCATLNWEKRHQSANLNGKVAVVTGARVKIGYQTCLKLLRAGATVVATTRFPNSAAANYRLESDFTDWNNRLHVYGLDLRDVTGIEAFCRFLKMRYFDSGIDILINNACQTVRRPTAYYLPACEKEAKLWLQSDETHKNLLGGCLEFERVRRRLLHEQKRESGANSGLVSSRRVEAGMANSVPRLLTNDESRCSVDSSELKQKSSRSVPQGAIATVVEEVKTGAPFETTGMSHSAAMSQMILLPEDAGVSDEILPQGVTDINGQQLDLRKTNSWLLKMEEVSTPEVMECMFINAIAPFVLNSRLKPLMSIPKLHEDRYIINVSAMEGKFYRHKMPNHPHTNMAKAAINMMTRTSAEDLAKNHKIFMNSVDTGWINDENPLEKASNIARKGFQTPIDEIDAAARILDPVFVGCNNPSERKVFGKFLKDYAETEW